MEVADDDDVVKIPKSDEKCQKIAVMKWSELSSDEKKQYLPKEFVSVPRPSRAKTPTEAPSSSTKETPQEVDVVTPEKRGAERRNKETLSMEALGHGLVAATKRVVENPKAEGFIASACKVVYVRSCEMGASTHKVSQPTLKSIFAEANRWSAKWSGPGNAGRPRGSKQVTDEELRAAITPFSADCSRFSRKIDDVFRHLTISKRRLAGKLKLKIGRRQLAQRMLKGCLGFCSGYRRSDDCQVPLGFHSVRAGIIKARTISYFQLFGHSPTIAPNKLHTKTVFPSHPLGPRVYSARCSALEFTPAFWSQSLLRQCLGARIF
jgi:hypothetical protein